MYSLDENQALSLTKTVPYKGLPSELTALIGKDSLPNQDELVQMNLLQAQVWDGDQFKLPKRVDEGFPPYIYKRPYGTLHHKKVWVGSVMNWHTIDNQYEMGIELNILWAWCKN